MVRTDNDITGDFLLDLIIVIGILIGFFSFILYVAIHEMNN